MATRPVPAPSDHALRPLRGRVAVVTGASSGIGAATARRLAGDGAAVALVARRGDRIEALAAELAGGGASVVAVVADVADRQAMERAAETVAARLGRVDVVVANAGTMLAAPFPAADPAEWERMIDVNLRGVLWTGRAFVDALLATADDGGVADLVHVGSIAGAMAYPGYGVYSATKAAVAQLTAGLRTELGPRGVRVRTVQPGLVRTELGSDMQDAGQRAGAAQMHEAIETLRAEDIAGAVAWSLAAPARMNVADLVVVATRQG